MPVYPTNVAANSQVTEKDSPYVKIAKGESIRVRVLPCTNEDGIILFRQDLHFKMKDPNSDSDRGTALGCGKYHGDGTCLVCDVVDVLKRSDDPNEKKLTKFPDDIGVSTAYYLPVLVASQPGGKGKPWEYTAPKLLRLTGSGADAVSGVNSRMELNDLPFINDEKQGQDVIITNPSTPGKYTLDTTSVLVDLKKIAPNWEDQMFKDVMRTLDTKIWTREQVKETLYHSLKQLDLDAIMAEIG